MVQTQETNSAVLDLHFSPRHPAILAVATSKGAVEIFRLQPQTEAPLKRVTTLSAFDPSILVTSLAWEPEANTKLAASLSDGRVALLDYENSPALIQTVQVHDLEAWTVAWSTNLFREGFRTLYSGGDDSRLGTISGLSFCTNHSGSTYKKKLDTPDTGYDDLVHASTSQISVNNKIHTAGVTAILPITSGINGNGEIVMTGSYDEHVRVLELTATNKWTALTKLHVGGGVWRLKCLSVSRKAEDNSHETRMRVLASCIHAGVRVIDVVMDSKGQWSLRVLYKFEEHGSMNYGSDTTILENPGGDAEKATIAVSTSFYDRKVCVWSIPAT